MSRPVYTAEDQHEATCAMAQALERIASALEEANRWNRDAVELSHGWMNRWVEIDGSVRLLRTCLLCGCEHSPSVLVHNLLKHHSECPRCQEAPDASA